LEARADELLPVPYFHVVFTVPQQIAAVAWANKKLVYEILFRAAAQTLLQIAHDPRHLGAQIGFLAILHTWTQTLLHHPHIHCVVPGGGLSPDRARWIGCRDNFFLPVKILSRLFAASFSRYSTRQPRAARCASQARPRLWPIPGLGHRFSARCTAKTGSSTPSHPSALRNRY
jgi:hypothetical protein